MSEFVKINYGATDGSIRPDSLQETGRPSSMTMQGLSPNVQYYAQAELYDGLQLVSQSLQETFRTLSAGTITLTHVSDTRSGGNYTITYTVSSTYALSSSVMTINGSPIQGVISGNTITYTVSGLTMGNTYPYNISTIDIYTETNTTSNSLVTVAQNYITIAYASKTSSSVTFDLDYVSDGGFYEGYIEYWSSEKDPSTDQADGHTFFQDGADTVTQSNLDDGTTYKFRATILQSVGGTEINSSVVTQSTDAHDYSGDYFTIKNEYAGNNTVTFKVGSVSGYSATPATFNIRKNGTGNWSTVTDSTTGVSVTLQQGDYLEISHQGALGWKTTNAGGDVYARWHTITASENHSVRGNVASLCFTSGFDSNITLPQTALFRLFWNNTKLVSAENLYMGSKITTSAYCYKDMFCGCTALTTTPEIASTSLADFSCNEMYWGCSSLVNAKPIKSASIGESACQFMFRNCSSLVVAPSISATSVGLRGFRDMFLSCYALTTPPSTLPATTLGEYAYEEMFTACNNLATAPVLPATNLSVGCYREMFEGCSSLRQAPALPATSLPKEAYNTMFYQCTSLTTAPDLMHVTSVYTDGNNSRNAIGRMYIGCTSLNVAYAPTIDFNNNSDNQWLTDVAASGTLFADKSIAATIPTSSTSGAPSGWRINVSDAQPTDYFTITNQTNTTNTISIVWQDMSGWEAQDIEFSTDGSNWDRVTATTAGATIATLPAFGSVKLRHTGTMQGNCFRGTGSHSVGGNIASLDLGSAYNVTGRTMPQAQFIQMFINDTTLVSAENLNFASYSGANASGCNQMFQGCTALVLPPDLSPIENHYGNQVFDMMFRGCTSLVKGTNLTKLKTYGWRAIFGMYSGCTALKELYYPDFQITNGEWWSIYGDFVDRTLGENAYATQDTYDNITSGDSSQNGWDYVCPSQWTLNVL